MVTKTIHLSSVERAKEFSSAMGEFKFPVDLSQPITVAANPPEGEEERFLQVLAEFGG